MPSQGLQAPRGGKELRRRSTFEFLSLSPPTQEDIPSRGTVSAEFQPRDRPETAGDQTLDNDIQRVSSFADSPTTTTGQSRPSLDSTWSRSFNFYKWRHASDSHLASKTKKQRDQDIPPVPALPLERKHFLTDFNRWY